MSERPEDPDRAAILARRQHFVALALSGLATTGCAGTTGKEEDAKKGAGTTTTQPDKPDPMISPCLSMMEPRGQPGLELGSTTQEAAGDSETDTGDTTTGEEPKSVPRPCLSKPRPCLKAPAQTPDEQLD